MPIKRPLVWLTWTVTFALACLCGTIFVQGLLRDRRAGDPQLPLNVAQSGEWHSARFRVWGAGRYKLFISSVNWDSTHQGAPLGAALEVALRAPNGRAVFQRTYPPNSTGLVLPINYGDSELAELDLDDSPLRRWTLQARVLSPDERFRTAQTTLKFWKQRYDPGMGGMMNYVMIFPAGFFLLLAGMSAATLARDRRFVPLGLTLAVVLVLVAVARG
jgi:hypothetical protein